MKKLLFMLQSVLSLVRDYLYCFERMPLGLSLRCLPLLLWFDIKDQSSYGVDLIFQDQDDFKAGTTLRDVSYNYLFKFLYACKNQRWLQNFNRYWVKSEVKPFFPLSMKCMTAGIIMFSAFTSAFYPKPNKNERNFTPMSAACISYLSGICP